MKGLEGIALGRLTDACSRAAAFWVVSLLCAGAPAATVAANQATVTFQAPADFVYDSTLLEIREGRVRLVDKRFGTGRDGDLIITTGTFDLSAQTTGGRSEPDGFLSPVLSESGPGAMTISVASTAGLAAGDELLIVASKGAGAGDWEYATVASAGAGALTFAAPLVHSFHASGAQVVRVPHYARLRVSSAATLTTKPWDGSSGGVIALRIRDSLTVAGVVSVAGRGYRAGPTLCTGCPGIGGQGEGADGGMTFGWGAAGNGGSGGGAEWCRAGNGAGGGGHAGTGGHGGVYPNYCGGWCYHCYDHAPGGGMVGDSALTRIFFGGGGGTGGHDGDNPDSGGSGGPGGGVILVSARSIDVPGVIDGSGYSAPRDATGESGGGGGGAGGALWLAARALHAPGTARVRATGGQGDPGPLGASGGFGSTGRIRLDYSTVAGAAFGTPQADSAAAALASPVPGMVSRLAFAFPVSAEIEGVEPVLVPAPFRWTRFAASAAEPERITWRFSVDGGATWLTWDGSAWAIAALPEDGCGTEAAAAGFPQLPATEYGVRWRASLNADVDGAPEIETITFGWVGRPPSIRRVEDVPNDQGGRVRVLWEASELDVPPDYHIRSYTLWRRITEEAAQGRLSSGARLVPPGRAVDEGGPWLRATMRAGGWVYWEYLATIPARGVSAYAYMAASIADTMPGFVPYNVFFVDAADDSGRYFVSEPDSGYSVDNLAPARPAQFDVAYGPGPFVLHWQPNREGDLYGYRLYRGSYKDFAPGPGNLIAVLQDTSYVDQGGGLDSCYKLSAVDVHMNESLFACHTPDGPTVALVSLVGAAYADGEVVLTWAATGNPGLQAAVLRRSPETEWRIVAEIADDAGGVLVFRDRDVQPGMRYGYRLLVRDGDREAYLGEAWVDVPAVTLALRGSRPNPSKGQEMWVHFTLPGGGPARLELWDVMGRRIAIRDLGRLGPGDHRLDLAAGTKVPAGVYILRLVRQGEQVTRRAVVVW